MTKDILNRFNELPLEKKAVLVSSYGMWLLCVHTPDGKYTVCLYSLESTIIEVFVNKKTQLIDQIWMPSYQELDCYMKNININSLMVS